MKFLRSRKYFRRFSCLLLTIFTIHVLNAQPSSTLFSHYDVHNGLIMNNVEYIQIDSAGFVWLGTYVGLQRFDGYEFKDYTFDPEDISSLSDNFIVTIFEDDSGNLWIGTSTCGLNIFNRNSGTFRDLRHNPLDPNSLASDMIPRAMKVITQDSEGYIWVNTVEGLSRIDVPEFNIESFYGDFSGQLVYDRSESALWIAGEQLKKFNLLSHKLSYFYTGQVNSIIQDSDGYLWLGTESGAVICNNHSNEVFTLTEYLKEEGFPEWNNQILLETDIGNFYEDFKGNIWFSTNDMLVKLDREKDEMKVFAHEPDNDNSPIGSRISGIYGNKSGVLWISYLNQGVSKVNIDLKKFNFYRKVPEEPNSLSGNVIRSIYLDNNQYLWVGTYDNGLNRITPGSEAIDHFMRDDEDPESIISNYIVALYVDTKERLWVGSFDKGLCFADDIYQPRGTLKFTNNNSFSGIEIHEFTEDPSGRIWISTNQGFFIYSYEDNSFVWYGDKENQLLEVRNLNIQSVIFEPPNLFWMATWNSGLCKLYIHSDTLMFPGYKKDSMIVHDNLFDQFNKRIDNKFINICRSDEGEIWLGSHQDGLIRIKDTGDELKLQRYDRRLGAPHNSILGLTSDQQGDIWISTIKGLAKFNPDSEQFRYYNMSDGLQSNSFIWDASFKAKDGRLFFGSTKGLSLFYPEEIVDNQDLPEVFISKLVINNTDVRYGDEINGRVILESDISYTEEISLTNKESVFSLEFTAIDNINPMEVIYRYKLEGFDDDWIQTTADNRSVRYTKLNAGTYTFSVKASNSDGIWNETPTELKIIILGPWWKTWWAIAIYTFIFLSLLVLFWRLLLLRTQLVHEAKMEHLERQKTEQMYQMKLRFFTSISHEFRTPLTLILGSLQKIISRLEHNEGFALQIRIIKRNSDRLFRLIDQIIEFRKIENNKLNLYAAKADMVSFVKELTDSFDELSSQRSITLDFATDMERCDIWFDENKLDKIVYNLLSNAFKFTPDKGHIKVGITLAALPSRDNSPEKESVNQNQYVKITVEDSGIGIAEKDLEHIFDRYFRVENPDRFVQSGSGIGLSLAKELTELHQGKVEVESKLGKGTCFTVYLPLGEDHLSEEDKVIKPEPMPISDFTLNTFSLVDEQEYISSEIMQPQLDQGDKPLIMVVDDDPELREFIKNNFSTDYIVIEAENGQEGFEMAVKNNPDVIISDIIMPVMDGIEFCKKLKSDIKTSHIPIVLLTAKAGMESTIEGLDTGAEAYISKPFTLRLIEVQLKNILKNREHLRKKFSKELILQPGEITITSLDEGFIRKAIEIVEDHMSDTEFTVETFNREVGMSRSRTHRKIKALTGQSTSEFIRTIRLKRAVSHLEKSQQTVEEVAYAVGFNSSAYFTKCFKIQFGITPSEFIKSGSDRS